MHSKVGLFLLTLLLITPGCSWWGGENTNNKVVDLSHVELLGGSSECIEHLDSFFGVYFKGQSQERDIKENVDCVKTIAAKIFEYAEEQSVEKGFSREEILTVLKSVFPRKQEQSLKDNIEMLFLAKRLFVGGLEDGFSRSESLKFEEALVRLEVEMLKGRIAVKHLFHSEKGFVEKGRNEAFSKMEEAFKNVDAIRADLGGKVTESEALGIIDQVFRGQSQIYKFKKLAVLAKDYLFGKGEPFRAGQKEFFSRVYVALEIQARIRLVDFSGGFLVGETFYDLQRALNLITGKMRLWSNKKKEYTLNISKVKELVANLHEVGVMNNLFSDPSVINDTLGIFLVNIFKTEDFDFRSFNEFDRIIQNWMARQNRLISKYQFSWIEGRLDSLNSESIEILKIVEAFKTPQFVVSPGQPVLIKRGNEELAPEKEYFDSSLKHTLYSLIEAFFKAYSPNVGLEKDADGMLALGLQNLTRIFDDIRPLALEMGFADPHTCNSVVRSFLEADVLTLSGNGDHMLSITEAIEWMGTMISTGSISNHIMNQVTDTCAIPGMKVLNHQFMSRECLKKEMFDKSTLYNSYFNTLQPYLDMLSSEYKTEEFTQSLDSWIFDTDDQEASTGKTYTEMMSTAFNSCGQSDFPVSKRELNLTIAVTIYVENIFYQFDKTGIRDHLWSDDPNGHDFILDGAELSKFFKEKAVKHADSFFEPYRNKEDKPWYMVSTDFLYDKIGKTVAFNFPESGVKMDRVGIYGVFKTVIVGSSLKGDNQFRKNYCNDVYSSFKTGVTYKKEEKLMCLEGE